jgi:hypothetical protein
VWSLVNGIISALLLVACGLLAPETPKVVMVTVLFLHGLSRSMQFTALNTLAFVDIPKALMSSATVSRGGAADGHGTGRGGGRGGAARRGMAAGERAGTLTLMDFHVAFWLVGALEVKRALLPPAGAIAHEALRGTA